LVSVVCKASFAASAVVSSYKGTSSFFPHAARDNRKTTVKEMMKNLMIVLDIHPPCNI
jgi:hypothetical protein